VQAGADEDARANRARHKPMQLGLEEFLRRLRLHFLLRFLVRVVPPGRFQSPPARRDSS
jgi:hypothetical protein